MIKMSEQIRKEIEEFKRNNGNDSFTQKEMWMYVVSKIEKINDKLEDKYLRKDVIYTGALVLFILIGALASYVIWM